MQGTSIYNCACAVGLCVVLMYPWWFFLCGYVLTPPCSLFDLQTLGCTPIADISHFSSDKFAFADNCAEASTSGGTIIKITGVTNFTAKTCCILVRGSNQLVCSTVFISINAFCSHCVYVLGIVLFGVVVCELLGY